MSRKLIITIHLYLAAFFTPILLITVVSGGLYLLGIKGEVERELTYQGVPGEFDITSEDIEGEIREFMLSKEIDYQFEYIKGGGNKYFTRPTSRDYYVFKVKHGQMDVIKQKPDFMKRLVELHKGHGPTLFKHFQKIMALGLVLILITGFYLGVTSPMLRKKTLLISSAGAGIFLLLISL